MASTSTSASAETVLPKLRGNNNSNNYKSWKEQMMIILEMKGLGIFIDGQAPPPPNDAAWSAWRQTDGLIKDWIMGSLSDEVAQTVANLGSAREVWLELEKNFSQPKEKGWNKYLPLYRATLRGDWDLVQKNFDQDSGAVVARISFKLETTLHVAVTTGKLASFVEKLMKCMPDASLSITDVDGFTPLHGATLTSNLRAVEILVQQLLDLLYISCKNGRFPVQWAADGAHRPTLEFLLSHTRDDLEINPFAGDAGVLLLCLIIDADYFDLALVLVVKYPYLAKMNSTVYSTALWRMAMKDTVFSMQGRS